MNKKSKISETIWDKEFELLDRSYSISDIQNYFKYINHKKASNID